MALITSAFSNFIATNTLNHPQNRNVPSDALLRQVIAALAEFTARKVRVAIQRAPSNAKVCSAGRGVSGLPAGRRDPGLE